MKPDTERNRALSELASKGEYVDEGARRDAEPKPAPVLSGRHHDLGGDVSAVLTSPFAVFVVGESRVPVYRGDVVKASAEFVDSRPFLVRL